MKFNAPGSEGVVVGAMATPTQGFTGTVSFVQLLNNRTITYTSPGYQNGGCSVTQVLDHTYPYTTVASVGPALYLYDSPSATLSAPLQGGGWTNIIQGAVEQFQATTYVMWQPSTPNSIPVPLGNLTWIWNGNAALTATWTLDNTDPGNPNNSTYFAFASSTAFPNWTSVATGNGNCQLPH